MPRNLRVAQLPLWQNLALVALPRRRPIAFARNWKTLWRQVMPQRLRGRHVACPGMIEQHHQAQILGTHDLPTRGATANGTDGCWQIDKIAEVNR